MDLTYNQKMALKHLEKCTIAQLLQISELADEIFDKKEKEEQEDKAKMKVSDIMDAMVKMPQYPKDVFACKTASPTVTVKACFASSVPCKKQEAEETAMCYNNKEDLRTEAQQAKDYLIKSLRNESVNKDIALEEAFNLHKRQIETMGELREAVKGSWFKVADAYKDYGDGFAIYGIWDFLSIENPNRKVDDVGYRAARKELTKAESNVKDQIVVFGAEKGLEALNQFKAQTFH